MPSRHDPKWIQHKLQIKNLHNIDINDNLGQQTPIVWPFPNTNLEEKPPDVVASRSSTDPDNLHHWSILCHLTTVTWFHAPTSTFTISPKACDKVVFERLCVENWVESHAPSLKSLLSLREHDKPFTALLLKLKEFSSFFIVLSPLFSQITCLHVSTWYVSISFDQTISILDLFSSLLKV